MTEQKRPEISIIVAVYKGEKYLNGCVDAILNQTFRDFEVILVDDGSPDNCPAMCDAIAKRDSRVRVIHQKNKGVDGAKNAGIDSARGNWIGFVDQDDLIDKTYYEKLYHAAQQAGAEIAVNGSYFNVKTFEPVTFVLLDRKIVGRTTPRELVRTNGVVAFKDKKGRKMDIFFCDTSEYRQVARRYRSVLAAGPVLIDGGRIVEYDSDKTFYTGRHPRTLIGKRADGEVVMAVIDGRCRGEGEGATIAETAYIARLLGLVEALNLDGGGSSTLWTARKGVLNHPYDNHRFDHAGERAVPNGIVARPRK